MRVRVHLLGRLCVEIDDVVVPGSALPGRQGRVAFAYLAANRHPVSRDALADVMWDDQLPEGWERHLASVLSKVRAVLHRAGLDDDRVLTNAFGSYDLRLPPDTEIDADAALGYLEDTEAALRADRPDEALAAADVAANLARRPFLPGDHGRWIEQKRSELRAVLVRALEIEAELLRVRGDHRYALRLAEEAVALEPFRESTWIELMRVHLAAGNRAEGLRAYQRCRVLLVEELGVPPSPDTESAYLELLHVDSSGPPGTAP
jgi:SARP family transcriptional regulator, regulator of embCAB operon